MVKKPEEIKKGLIEPELFCSHCEYSGEPHGCNRPNGSCQAFDNADDALEYIQQLEAQNAELVKKFEQLQRDAAVETLKQEEAEEKVRCADCEFLMFSDCYGECSKGHRGLVDPDDTCPHGVRRSKNNEKG